MELNLEKIQQLFLDVLSGRISREEANRWAYSVVQQSELGTLAFLPASDKDRIWGGVMYLYGIDLMEEPGVYLHTNEDIRTAMIAKVGNA